MFIIRLSKQSFPSTILDETLVSIVIDALHVVGFEVTTVYTIATFRILSLKGVWDDVERHWNLVDCAFTFGRDNDLTLYTTKTTISLMFHEWVHRINGHFPSIVGKGDFRTPIFIQNPFIN